MSKPSSKNEGLIIVTKVRVPHLYFRMIYVINDELDLNLEGVESTRGTTYCITKGFV